MRILILNDINTKRHTNTNTVYDNNTNTTTLTTDIQAISLNIVVIPASRPSLHSATPGLHIGVLLIYVRIYVLRSFVLIYGFALCVIKLYLWFIFFNMCFLACFVHTPGLHNKIPALKIFARGWVAQEPICS